MPNEPEIKEANAASVCSNTNKQHTLWLTFAFFVQSWLMLAFFFD